MRLSALHWPSGCIVLRRELAGYDGCTAAQPRSALRPNGQRDRLFILELGFLKNARTGARSFISLPILIQVHIYVAISRIDRGHNHDCFVYGP